jgi:hypothetical protein
MLHINSVQLENLAFSESYSFQKKPLLEARFNKLNNLTRESENMADTLEMQTGFATSKGATEALMAASVHQKEIVAQMMSSNPEDSISLVLAASIEAYGKQLEAINAWTEGGAAVLEPMLDMIYESILVDGVEGTEYEDLMQLLIIDLTLHEEEWGLDPSEIDKKYASKITEFFGSGQHNPYGDYGNYPPEKVIAWFLDSLIPRLESKIPNPIPNTSLTAQIVEFYSDDNNKRGLEQCANDYWSDPDGFINGSDEFEAKQCEQLSPILKIFIISDAAEEGNITAEEWDQLLTGDVSDFEELLGLDDGGLGLYLMTNVDGWVPKDGMPGHEGSDEHCEENRYPDWTGSNGEGSTGISAEDLLFTLNSFPPRDLTEDEIEEVNRIGDQVKMLQQTLLYWLKICRDEQMAIAQNT